MADRQNPQLERKITVAYLAQWFETLWSALLWPLLTLLLILALLFSGFLIALPAFVRGGILAVLVLLYLWSCRTLLRIKRPQRREVLRQLEDYSELPNRPLSGLNDTLSQVSLKTSESVESLKLWQEHQRRQALMLAQVKVKPPRSHWYQLDQTALRVPVIMLLLACLILIPNGKFANLKQSLSFAQAPALLASQNLDAWLKPPAYTGKAPILLTSPAQLSALKVNPIITAPQDSVLSLHVSNAGDVRLTVTPSDASTDEQPLTLQNVKKTETQFEAEAILTTSATVRLYDEGTSLASWQFQLISDQPPSISVVETPTANKQAALVIKWRGQDDYGLTDIKPIFSLSDVQADGVGFSGSGVFNFEPPKFAIPFRTGVSDQTSSVASDQTAHPWAGLMVDLTLQATDSKGQTSSSKPVTFKMPEKMFLNPLAQALIEQRKSLILDSSESQEVGELLQALIRYPKRLISHSGMQISLAGIASRLQRRHDLSEEEIALAMEELWQIALQAETGRDPSALEELEKARAALAEAMRRGAPPEQIRELEKRYRSAMQNYLNSLAQNNQGQSPSSDDAQGKSISPQDLQAMMDKIEELNKQGKTAEAQELLSQLNEILKNLRMGNGSSAGNGNPAPGLMKELGEMLKKQQQLLDRTQRQKSGKETDPEGKPDANAPSDSEDKLADEQQNLQQQLRKFQNKLGGFGLAPPSSLGEAGKNMGDASESLKDSESGEAMDEQSEAMKNLRDGARQLSQQFGQQQGSGSMSGSDPLGRSKDNNGHSGDGQDLGDLRSQEMRRASEILKELRDRLGLPSLESSDRSYIERLLDGLN